MPNLDTQRLANTVLHLANTVASQADYISDLEAEVLRLQSTLAGPPADPSPPEAEAPADAISTEAP